MKHSPLHSQHQSLGAQIEPVGEWEMSAHYGNPIAEHLAVRKDVGLADLSHRGLLQVTGNDRVSWLQSIISNDILPLQTGQWLYSSFMSHKGKILSYFRVYCLEEFLLVEDTGEVGDTTFQTFRKFLLYGTKAKMKSCSETWGLLLVSGPKAPQLISRAFGIDASNLKIHSFLKHDFNGQQLLIAKTEETGEHDFELFAPFDVLPAVWEQVWASGTPLGLHAFGTQTRETLRIEAGIPKLGPDLNEQIVPPEANLEGKAFSLTKGCYPGQEVVARMDTYGSVKRRLVGLVIETPVNQVPSPGTKIYKGDREVGWISSATYSPSLQKTIALAFPLRDFTIPKTELSIAHDQHHYPAFVQPLPFYPAR
ncbi:aminomethyltransferase family protein [Candidatus Nitronereus thalassa]|uniref:Aminomethyltransferase family protein n=1 Tax=Candidatus Nitronereus thalassa TaxID=3020898 RepID=A0ABU3K846_9BACT|nr:aminomethyltransferase family protein [Candidatus Nitronereus thalassa]MDT7042560.1 aminomethyltransferase family protein [Candidatus Nitronereus thalassa]